MRNSFFMFFICLAATIFGFVSAPKANATEVTPRYVYTSSALIIELRHPVDRASRNQRYAGFSRDFKIDPYIRPTYLETRRRVHEQRFTGFKRVYKERCRRCQFYTGFRKTYSGQRYSGFTDEYPQSRYLTGSFNTIFRSY